MIKHVLLIAALSVLVGCNRQEEPRTDQLQATADSYDHRPIVITKEGQLLLESKPITDADLVAMVKKRVAQFYQTKGTVDMTVIMLEPHDQTTYGRVREIQDLIMKHGGCPGTARKKGTQLPAGDVLKAAPEEERAVPGI